MPYLIAAENEREADAPSWGQGAPSVSSLATVGIQELDPVE